MGWTKHQIPFRAKDPNTGFFMECLVKAPNQIRKLDQLIECDLAINPLFFDPIIFVDFKDIYPTARNLTKVQDKVLVDVEQPSNFFPDINIPIDKNSLQNFFNSYPKVSFTKNEIEVAFNNKLAPSFIKRLKPGPLKICLIDSKLSPSYIGIDDIFITIPKTKTTMTHEVATKLLDLYKQYKTCTLCNLGQDRVARNIPSVVPARIGNTSVVGYPDPIPSNLIFFIGEAPGKIEEETNIPFNPEAPAGSILDKVIKAANIDINSCYFTNSVICRPISTDPGTQNTNPSISNIKTCNSRLKNEMAIVKPSIVVLLGRYAYTSFFGTEPKNVLSLTGWLNDDQTIYFMPHPSFIARELSFTAPENKADIKNKYLTHFRAIKEKYDRIVSKN